MSSGDGRGSKRDLEISKTVDANEKKSKLSESTKVDIEVAKLRGMEDSVLHMSAEFGEEGQFQRHSSPISKQVPITMIDEMKIAETVITEAKESIKTLLPDDKTDKIHEIATALTAAMSNAVIKILSACAKQMVVNVQKAVDDVALQMRASAFSPGPDPAVVSLIRKNYYYNDSNEQYSRRESIRIHGLAYAKDEKVEEVEKKAMKVFEDAGLEIEDRDISILHRAGKEKDGTKPILVKFISRKTRNDVMKMKKNLKEKEGYEGVFITDDLTPLRMRLLGYVKKLPGVKKAWSYDGKIKVEMEQKVDPNDKSSIYTIQNPDDLFDLGYNQVDYHKLGLDMLAFDAHFIK